MEIYLDNSSTTKVCLPAAEKVMECMTVVYGNPSSLHSMGFAAEKEMTKARASIAKQIGVKENEIIFTSGGTEANNLAVFGAVEAKKRFGNKIVTTAIEHPSVLGCMEQLEKNGFEVVYLKPDMTGAISPEQVMEAIDEHTVLVSMMLVNNEVGSILPIEAAAKAIKQKKSPALFHVDAVQGFGKYRIFPKREGIDLLTVSSHKIHGPKGMGALYISDKVKIRPIVFGGEQQKNIRSGTENVPGIAGFALAAKMIYSDLEEKTARMRKLKERFIEGIRQVDHVSVHGLPDETSAPHIVSVGIAGIRSEVLLHTLEEKGIYVSSGSACSSNHPGISGVLKGIGVEREYLDATLRFSLSEFTTEEEIDYTLKTLYNCIPMLRRYRRR